MDFTTFLYHPCAIIQCPGSYIRVESPVITPQLLRDLVSLGAPPRRLTTAAYPIQNLLLVSSHEDLPLFLQLVSGRRVFHLVVLTRLRLDVDILVNNAGITQPLKIMDIAPQNYDAVLDVNLSDQDSLPVAQALRARAIPFVFATGYGSDIGLPDSLSDIPVAAKPYQIADILQKLAEAEGR